MITNPHTEHCRPRRFDFTRSWRDVKDADFCVDPDPGPEIWTPRGVRDGGLRESLLHRSDGGTVPSGDRVGPPRSNLLLHR